MRFGNSKSFRGLVLAAAMVVLQAVAGHSQINELERVPPESVGVSSKALCAMFDSLTSLPNVEIHSVMVLRKGKVIGEVYPKPFAPQYKHTLYSCSKTFVSAAIGLVIDENRLRLDDRVAPFFAGYLPDTISVNLASVTVRDLLTMTSGIVPDWGMRDIRKDWIRGYLGKPVSEPGKTFMYDSMCTYLLSAIVEKVTGMKTLDYLKKKIFTPMHIEDVEWEVSPDGYNTGGWGLLIQPESMAKFGQLLLNGGKWNGKQLISRNWVRSMMTRQEEAGTEDYCYQMWMCDYPGAVRADGAYGQYIIIVPETELVVVVTQCSLMDGLKERNIIWRTLMPGIKGGSEEPGKDYQTLQAKQKSYILPTVKGKASSSLEKAWNGVSFSLDENKLGWHSLKLKFTGKSAVLEIIETNGDRSEIKLGYGQWATSAIKAYPPYSITAKERFNGLKKAFSVAGSYAWTSAGTLSAKLHYVDWISALDLKLHFGSNGTVEVECRPNYTKDVEKIKGTVPR